MLKIALICNSSEQIGIQYISACLKQNGYTTRLFLDPSVMNDKIVFNYPGLETCLSMKHRMVKAIEKWKPDLIGISTVTITYQWAKDVARQCKQVLPDVPVIVGGPHAQLTPETVIADPAFDMVCTGEGEQAIVELADSLAAGRIDTSIKDIWFKVNGGIVKNPLRHLNEDLDSLPFPDRSIYEPYFNLSDSLLTMSMRGCLFKCAYCSHNALRKKYKGKGNYVRRKSPEKFIEELQHFKKQYDFKFIRIYDDIFTHDIKWLKKFVPLYKTYINLPFFCLSHPRYLSEEAIRLIKDAGCNWIQVGIESFNEKTRFEVLNRPEKNSEIISSISLLEKYKLRYELDFIFGLPGDDEETYQQTVDFLKTKTSLNRVSALVLSFLPKTEIIEHSIQCRDIDSADIENINEGREGCQTDKGSIRDRKKRTMADKYNLLYRLCAFLGPKQIDSIQASGLYRIIISMNPVSLYVLRLFGMDRVDRAFVKLTLNQLIKIIFNRNNYYPDTGEK